MDEPSGLTPTAPFGYHSGSATPLAPAYSLSIMRLPFVLDRPLVFLDLETTGLSPSHDRIVELAVIKVTPRGDVLERVRRFNPGTPIPKEATAVHGITDADVRDEASFAQRARSLAELLDGCDLAGFNVRRFDLPMLLAEFRRAEVPFEARGRRVIDIQAIFHREERRDLSAAARFYLGREHPEAHSALGDIRTSAAVLAAQLERYTHLPRDLDGLHGYCDEYLPMESELERWFEATEEGTLVFRRGKHRGRALADVAQNEPDYLGWMLGAEDMDDEVLRVVREALDADARLEAAPTAEPEGTPPPG
jgi:DNA polymerase-3 subunit epsilon